MDLEWTQGCPLETQETRFNEKMEVFVELLEWQNAQFGEKEGGGGKGMV